MYPKSTLGLKVRFWSEEMAESDFMAERNRFLAPDLGPRRIYLSIFLGFPDSVHSLDHGSNI